DSALPKVSLPVRSSKAAISVKVPPMSAASRRLEPLAADGMRCFMFRLANVTRAAHSDETPLPGAGKGSGVSKLSGGRRDKACRDGAGETRMGRPLGPLHWPKRIV